ncbi:MAG TPA: sigma-54 dependent transcriptional regulator [Longimicrobiales bacterium]
MRRRILVIDDERNFREFLGEALEAEGYAVATAGTARVGLALAMRQPPDVVLLDQNLPDRSGLELVPEFRRLSASPAVIVITAYAAYPRAVEAIKAGAFHYLAKPFEFEELLRTLAQVCSARGPRDEAGESPALASIVGESPAILALKRQVVQVARSPVDTVLVCGESGTGKELVARAIHSASDRAGARMLSVNCAAFTDTLLTSELFGHERGAFTDAREQKKGIFEAAAGGTLFLDEIGELSARDQAALLRVLEQRTVIRVGGTEEVPVDVRVIAATNRPPDRLVTESGFRADLFYRLNIVRLTVPPLRARGDDVLLLAHHFSAAAAARFGVPARAFAPDAQELLRRYAWPGNVRELRNAVERAYAIGTGTHQIAAADLGTATGAPETGPAPPAIPFPEAKRRAIADFERQYVTTALERAAGNISLAARNSGIPRQVFQRLLRKHEVRPTY